MAQSLARSSLTSDFLVPQAVRRPDFRQRGLYHNNRIAATEGGRLLGLEGHGEGNSAADQGIVVIAQLAQSAGTVAGRQSTAAR